MREGCGGARPRDARARRSREERESAKLRERETEGHESTWRAAEMQQTEEKEMEKSAAV